MAANGMAALGMAEKAKSWADRAWAMRREDAMTLYNVGCVYSLLGLKDEAIAVLSDAVKHGLRHKGWFINDSNLDPLREDARFQRLVESID
jgi:adenylate cyclase